MEHRILIADADAAYRRSLELQVGRCGVASDSAASGAAAFDMLTKAEAGRYVCALVDLSTPGFDGAKMMKDYRDSAHPDAHQLPLVGLVAPYDSELIKSAYAAGAFSVLRKPVSAKVMTSFVTLMCESRDSCRILCSEAYLQNRRLREERDHALEVERSRSYFFSTVSHDIRTPLNAIIGFSQMLSLGFDDPAEEKRAIDSIIVSGKTLLQLVNDVLDLSKLEAGKMTIEPEPSDCVHIVDEIVESFRVVKPSSKVDIRRKSVTKMPMVMIDPQRIRQILFNLVGNAVKFTERGYIEIRMAFEPTGERVGTLRLEIEDTGCGISEKGLEQITSPYTQFSKGARKSGTGLGLAICRQLVSAMSGELAIRSDEGVGTMFRVTIPNVREGTDVLRKTLSATQRIRVVSMRDDAAEQVSRVLVVDDSTVNLLVLKTMLQKLNVKDIVTATSGREAIDILMASGTAGRAAFDAVLTDMWMPGMDGEAMIKVIRAQPHLVRLPVYAVTADVEARKSAAALGFDGVLLKPVTIAELQQVLSEIGRKAVG